MRTIRLSSWTEFVDRLGTLPGWAFRGEVSARWPLFTSLGRRMLMYFPDRRLWPLRESRALRIFRRKAHNYLDDVSALDDDLRALALMQHHGAPTRLLDFTKSPYVAAFFALESAAGDAAVYALNTPALWDLAPEERPDLTRDAIDPRVAGHFEKHFLGNGQPVVWFGEPSAMDRRLVAQSGLFVVPGVIDQPLDLVLGHYRHGEELLLKFVLPIAVRAEAMEALYRMNVTYANLFPDLEGLAKASAYELEVVWERLVEDYLAGRQ
jgi:hypothetical protein